MNLLQKISSWFSKKPTASKTATSIVHVPKKPEPLFLAFDTETSGRSPTRDRIVQLAAVLFDANGKMIDSMSRIVKPVGFKITNSKHHGITQKRALAEGHDLETVLLEFMDLVHRADYLVAHNLKFDFDFVTQECIRVPLNKVADSAGFFKHKQYCTMKSTSHFCKLQYSDERDAYKFPRLVELHIKLFGFGFTGEHTALNDTKACVRCFVELRKNHEFYGPDWVSKHSGYSNRNHKPKNLAE